MSENDCCRSDAPKGVFQALLRCAADVLARNDDTASSDCLAEIDFAFEWKMGCVPEIRHISRGIYDDLRKIVVRDSQMLDIDGPCDKALAASQLLDLSVMRDRRFRLTSSGEMLIGLYVLLCSASGGVDESCVNKAAKVIGSDSWLFSDRSLFCLDQFVSRYVRDVRQSEWLGRLSILLSAEVMLVKIRDVMGQHGIKADPSVMARMREMRSQCAMGRPYESLDGEARHSVLWIQACCAAGQVLASDRHLWQWLLGDPL